MANNDEIFQELASIDKLIHEPARLSIMTALMACENADFLFMQRLAGLAAGNLSVHLAKLEEGGLVKSEKRFIDKRPNTMIEQTDMGKLAIAVYWQKMEQLRKSANDYQKSG